MVRAINAHLTRFEYLKAIRIGRDEFEIMMPGLMQIVHDKGVSIQGRHGVRIVGGRKIRHAFFVVIAFVADGMKGQVMDNVGKIGHVRIQLVFDRGGLYEKVSGGAVEMEGSDNAAPGVFIFIPCRHARIGGFAFLERSEPLCVLCGHVEMFLDGHFGVLFNFVGVFFLGLFFGNE